MPPFVGGVNLSPLLIEENLLYSHRRKKSYTQNKKVNAKIQNYRLYSSKLLRGVLRGGKLN